MPRLVWYRDVPESLLHSHDTLTSAMNDSSDVTSWPMTRRLSESKQQLLCNHNPGVTAKMRRLDAVSDLGDCEDVAAGHGCGPALCLKIGAGGKEGAGGVWRETNLVDVYYRRGSIAMRGVCGGGEGGHHS